MYLNFKKIDSEKRDAPMLRLRTLAGKELGPVPFVYGLRFEINYSDLSTIEFQTPYMVNGALNPLYSALTGYKVIYTEALGVYLITNPEKSGDGVSEVKQVRGYSLEYLFNKKNLYLDEGTYCFWNPMFPAETILGRVAELDGNWSVGYVAPRLMNCYRTFDGYDDSALNFCYGDVMEKYRCAIVFDVYNKTINAYDAGDEASSLPIYLDYENLVKEIKVTEDDESMATKLCVYGGDSLTIRDVNPIGGDYLVDLSYFLSNGDLDITAPGSVEMLSDKVRRWRADVLARQPYYAGIVALRSSVTAKKLTLEAELRELNGELQTLTAKQSVYIQEYALATTDGEKTRKQKQLDDIYDEIAEKNKEITAKEAEIANAQADADGYLTHVKELTDQYSISGYFTEEEQKILTQYLMDGELTEETFVAAASSASDTAVSSTLTGNVLYDGGDASMVKLAEFDRTIYTIAGGTLTITSVNLSAQVVRGTLEVKSDNGYVFTAYLGSLEYNGHDFSEGMITLTGDLLWLYSDIAGVTENSVTQYKGTYLSFRTSKAGMYFTVAGNDFQQYAVELELYEFGADALSDYAWPAYEFDVDAANFLYHEKFEPFKDHLELGKSVHLRLGSEGLIHPKIIGVELDYDDITNFSLLFSNRYQRKDELEYLSDEVHSAAKTSARFDASKYLYDRAADQMTDVDAYMNSMLDVAVQTIKAAANQSVMIDSAGIHVSSTDNDIQLRIVNGMIAMSDDGWQTAKLAIGRFYSNEQGMNLWGVNAELIAGTLLIGGSLYIQSQGGYFTVDDTGVYINSLKFYINNNKGNSLKNILDSIDSDIDGVDGKVDSVRADFDSVTTKTTNGITLNAEDMSGIINAQQAKMKSGGGNVLFDSDGFWLLNNTTKATSTQAIWMNEEGILFGSGSKTSDPGAKWTNWTTAINHSGIVADNIAAGTLSGMTINGGSITIGKTSTSDKYYLQVDTNGNLGIGENAGAKSGKGFNFYVDYMGNMYATSGQFYGVVQASDFRDKNGNSMLNSAKTKFLEEYLTLDGIKLEFNNQITTVNGDISELSSSLEMTASELKTEFTNEITKTNGDVTALSSKLTQTASDITATFNKAIYVTENGKLTDTTKWDSAIKASAESLTTTFNKAIYVTENGKLTTTKQWSSEIAASASSLTSTFTSQINTINGTLSTVKSTAEQTAEGFNWLVESSNGGSSFSITDSAITAISEAVIISNLQSDKITIKTTAGNEAGTITTADASSTTGKKLDIQTDAISIGATKGSFYASAGTANIQVDQNGKIKIHPGDGYSTEFEGKVNFSGATVTGLSATFG